jgi:hypothetical protein
VGRRSGHEKVRSEQGDEEGEAENGSRISSGRLSSDLFTQTGCDADGDGGGDKARNQGQPVLHVCVCMCVVVCVCVFM